jgi:hypothetical protein
VGWYFVLEAPPEFISPGCPPVAYGITRNAIVMAATSDARTTGNVVEKNGIRESFIWNPFIEVSRQ